jgi:hypothetical protein
MKLRCVFILKIGSFFMKKSNILQKPLYIHFHTSFNNIMYAKFTYNITLRVFVLLYYYQKPKSSLYTLLKNLSSRGMKIVRVFQSFCFIGIKNYIKIKNCLYGDKYNTMQNNQLEKISFFLLMREVIFLIVTSLILYKSIR